MRDPIHWIKPGKSRDVPFTPCDVTRFGASHRRLHQCPAAQNDERAYRVETEARNLPPGAAQDRHRPGDQIAPVVWRKLVMLEDGAEKMKVNDEQNRQAFGD